MMEVSNLQYEPAPSSELDLPIYIDSSMLSTWRACRRKFFWSTVHGLYPSGKSVHLVAGGAFAAGMEAARKRIFLTTDTSSCSFDDILSAAYYAFAQEWGTYQAPENSAKDFINTFSALREYLETFDPRTDAVQPHLRPDGSPAVEFTFSIPLDIEHPSGIPFIFVGRFDLLGMYANLPCIVDEKTTSSIGFAWESQWDLRGQFLGYCWACQQLDYPINTAVIRGIAIQKKEIKFATAIKQYPQYLIERWYHQTIKDVSEIVEAYDQVRVGDFMGWNETADFHFPYNFADACASYGGCAFATLCSVKDPEPFFSNYVRHRWDPLAKQPVKEVET